ncbi:hypothetical protein N0V84_005876 [Fusarium piperis]|uniref:Uncharacterized protein n=1 Tax=Fusarium piperis TaxID=1435070 RepID=A0A9W8WCV5_9HYPO|nr:hypothetical protein N0V84_005876 [Fusarium piperis]
MAHDALVSISKPPNGFPHMFEKYFASGDKTKVEVIFKSIIGSGSDPYLGNDRLENVHFTDADLNGLCDPITDPKPGTILMYTYNELVDKTKPSFIVVCPILWTLDIPNAKDIKPSWLRKDEVIIDGQMKKPDGSIVYLYDTYYTQELIRTKNNHEIAKALTNADSYAMFAREAYFRTYCPGMPFPDPKSYEPDPRVQHPRKAGVPSASEL